MSRVAAGKQHVAQELDPRLGRLRFPSAVSACILISILHACADGGSEPASSVTARDSAGIHITEADLPTWGTAEAWHLSATPSLSIGGQHADPAYNLYGVVNVQQLSTGEYVVADAGSSQLRYFDSRGSHARTVGRAGQGPGEFRFMSLMWRAASDTVAVMHFPGVSYFSPEATFVRTVALDLPEEGYRPQAISQLDDGTIFAMASRGFGAADAGTVIRDSTRFYSYSQDGKVSSKIAVLPSAERWGLLAGGVLMFPYVPFTAQLLWATGSGEIHITTGKGGEVRSWDNMGRLVQISRWRIVARPVTDEIRDNYRRDLLASTTSDDARRRYEVFLAETPMADTLPAYQTMLVDVLGNRWLERYRASGETQPAWDVISADGAWLGSVPMPARFSLRQVGRDFVLGVWRDDDDVEHVHRYDLIKAGSR